MPGELPRTRAAARKTQAHRPGAGFGDCTHPSDLPRARAPAGFAFTAAPGHAAPRIHPAFYALAPSSFLLHPRQGLSMWLTDDAGRDSPRNRFAFCREDVRAQCCPPGARPSPLSSPKPKPEREVRATTPPRHLLPQNVAAEGHGRKYGRQVCGANESWGSLSVRVPICHMHEDAVPTGPAVSPPRGPSAQAARGRLRPSSTATLSTRTGPGTSSHTPGWSGFGAGRRQL